MESARRGGGRSQLLPSPELLTECERLRAERLAALKAKNYVEAAELRDRERELLKRALQPAEERQERLLSELWTRLAPEKP